MGEYPRHFFMGKPNFSAELPAATLQYIEELRPLFNGNKTQIIIQAVKLLHQQEIKSMNTQIPAVTIEKIDTKPQHDPYTNIDGIVSRTYLKLDPRDRTVWVEQEYQDNATPADEWHGRILTWRVNSHPSEETMRQWITDNLDRLTAICDGYEVIWNGNNHVGRLTDEARDIQEAIEFEFDNDAGPVNYYEVWQVENWLESCLSEITAETTDEELAGMVDSWQPDSSTIVTGDMLDYATKRRDTLKWERDTYGDEAE